MAAQADRYRLLDHEAGDLIARHLDELAGLIRFVQARTPGAAADRIASLERDRDDRERYAAP